jgi:hypothetical protein
MPFLEGRPTFSGKAYSSALGMAQWKKRNILRGKWDENMDGIGNGKFE